MPRKKRVRSYDRKCTELKFIYKYICTKSRIVMVMVHYFYICVTNSCAFTAFYSQAG